MTKKFIIPLILIFILNNCGYTPIYSTKYQDFKLSNIILNGERDINKILKRRLDNYTKNNSAEKIYNVTINSSLQKNIASKDKKGNPKIDKQKREFERIPFSQNIEEYLLTEVKPHLSEFSYNKEFNKIGYEISLTKEFYDFSDFRSAEEVKKDFNILNSEILDLEKNL